MNFDLQREILSRAMQRVRATLAAVNAPDAGEVHFEPEGDNHVARNELCSRTAERLHADRFSPFPIRRSCPPHDFGTLRAMVTKNPWSETEAPLLHLRLCEPSEGNTSDGHVFMTCIYWEGACAESLDDALKDLLSERARHA